METKKKKGVGTRAPMPCQPAEGKALVLFFDCIGYTPVH